MIGLAVAYPLFNSNINTDPKYPNGRAQIDLDVAYAYFSTQPVSENIESLYRNNKDPASIQDTIGSFFVVLNITNYSNVSVIMNEFFISAAKEMNITYTPNQGSAHITYPFFIYRQIENNQQNRFTSADDLTWKPYESRLVALSGITQFANRTLLETGTFYIGGQVAGDVIDGLSSQGGGSKLIHMERFGNEYLYNNLVGKNEMLRLYYSSSLVAVGPRS